MVTRNDVYTLKLYEWQTTQLLHVVESVIAAAMSCTSEASTGREDESTASENEDSETEIVAGNAPWGPRSLQDAHAEIYPDVHG